LRKVTVYLTETFFIYAGYYFLDIFQSPVINFTLFFAGAVSSEGKLRDKLGSIYLEWKRGRKRKKMMASRRV
jgi:hypothetical protein